MNLEDGLVTIKGEAQLSLASLVDLGEQVLADPGFDPYLPQLVDLRGMEVARDKAAAEALRHFTLSIYRPRVHSSIAIVVDGSLNEAELAGLYHLSCAMDKTELFDHYDQALKWLMRREFA
jgi:hypothetical protein